MENLTCEHCGYKNRLSSRYLTFCKECGRKLTFSFSIWHKENPSRSFNDFKKFIANKSVPAQKSNLTHKTRNTKRNKKWLVKIMAGFIFLLVSAWAVYQINFSSEMIMEWTSHYIPVSEYDTQEWQPYINPKANFEIKFPGTPLESVEVPDSSLMALEHLAYTYTPDNKEDENMEYCISYETFPIQMIRNIDYNQEKTNKFLEVFIYELMKTEQGVLRANHDILYGLYPGKECIISVQGGMGEIKCRLYLIENTVYQLQVYTPINNLDNKARNYYLNSFKLLSYAQSASN